MYLIELFNSLGLLVLGLTSSSYSTNPCGRYEWQSESEHIALNLNQNKEVISREVNTAKKAGKLNNVNDYRKTK